MLEAQVKDGGGAPEILSIHAGMDCVVLVLSFA
jgi:hypothetical protein